jgi:hypothetical protein
MKISKKYRKKGTAKQLVQAVCSKHTAPNRITSKPVSQTLGFLIRKACSLKTPNTSQENQSTATPKNPRRGG